MMQKKRRESPEGPDLQLVALAKETLGSVADVVYGIATSRWLHMAILRVFLTISFTTFAYYLAIPAYAYFYHVHLPDQIITAPLHLRYGWQLPANENVFAIASLTHKTIKTLQPYDVDITLTLPRSPANLAIGNFMVGLLLLGDDPDPLSANNATVPGYNDLIVPLDPRALSSRRPNLHSSLRATRLPYRSPLVTLAASIIRLPYYALYPDTELTTLTIVMAERLTFPRGAPVPHAALVEIQARGLSSPPWMLPPPDVSTAQVTLRSQLGGLRWLMYHYRVTSFVVFTAMFLATAVWCFLVTFTVGGLVVRGLMPGQGGGGKGEGDWVDEEEDDMSDTERTFPGRTGGSVVKFEGKGVEVKVEDEEEQDPGVMAGDEEDEGEGVVVGGIMGERDSGIGTSYDDETGREGARRRASGKGKEKMEA